MTAFVVGLGNVMRGDDGAGLAVAERLGPDAAVAVSGDPLQAIDMWQGRDHVVIVDAMRSGAAVGTTRWMSGDECGDAGTYPSTHSVGPVELISMARALDQLPERLEVVGIEAGRIDLGAPMSPEVAQAVEAVIEVLRCA